VGELLEVTVSAYAARSVYFVVPDAVDNPGRISGGNIYDQHVRDGLRRSGWDVRMEPIPEGRGPAGILQRLPDDALTLIDGLIAARLPEELVAQSSRLRMVVLAHMVSAPVEHARDALPSAKRIITTSDWTRSELISLDLAEPGHVVVAHPGTVSASQTVASRSGGRLLNVGVVSHHKGQDLLIRALGHLTDVDDWTCTIVGSLDAAPAFVDELTRAIRRTDLTTRTTLTGVLTGSLLDRAYSEADLVVVPSRSESYGMVVAEALARGIPVLAARVGGIPEALSSDTAGVMVPPEDPWALELVLRQWWASPERRTELKTAAVGARALARPWSGTVDIIAATLDEILTETAVSA
jgi:glycosyltransferase involved in cell wall biosynthesis